MLSDGENLFGKEECIGLYREDRVSTKVSNMVVKSSHPLKRNLKATISAGQKIMMKFPALQIRHEGRKRRFWCLVLAGMLHSLEACFLLTLQTSVCWVHCFA